MKVDALIPAGIAEARAAALRLEALGFDGLWVAEARSDPFLDLVLPAVETTRPLIGTQVAIAFARSPFVTAVNAWQLQIASRGRFALGLGTQVKGHIERRFGTRWESPGPKLREYVQAVKAIWRAFQKEERLDFRGRFYTHTMLPSFFDPGPISGPPPQVFVGAVNEFNCETAGRVADGILVHPLHTEKYLREVTLPAVERGLAASGRSREDVTVVCPVFLVTGETPAERAESMRSVRAQIAFYGSTRTYARVFELSGWGDAPERLHGLMAKGDVVGMTSVITDEMVEAIAIGKPLARAPAAIRSRYEGSADRVCIYNLLDSSFALEEEPLRKLVAELQA